MRGDPTFDLPKRRRLATALVAELEADTQSAPADRRLAECLRDLYDAMAEYGAEGAAQEVIKKAMALAMAVYDARQWRKQMRRRHELTNVLKLMKNKAARDVGNAFMAAWVDNDIDAMKSVDPGLLEAILHWAVKADKLFKPKWCRLLRHAIDNPPPPRKVVTDMMGAAGAGAGYGMGVGEEEDEEGPGEEAAGEEAGGGLGEGAVGGEVGGEVGGAEELVDGAGLGGGEGGVAGVGAGEGAAEVAAGAREHAAGAAGAAEAVGAEAAGAGAGVGAGVGAGAVDEYPPFPRHPLEGTVDHLPLLPVRVVTVDGNDIEDDWVGGRASSEIRDEAEGDEVEGGEAGPSLMGRVDVPPARRGRLGGFVGEGGEQQAAVARKRRGARSMNMDPSLIHNLGAGAGVDQQGWMIMSYFAMKAFSSVAVM
ncbi:hypothetical protein V8C86DRAFT_3107953 [Haematococcus lacustris]